MSEYIGTILSVPLILLLIAVVIVFGIWGYVGIAVDSAAYSCARMGAATLNPQRGVEQAIWAARETLKGYHLNPDSASITVYGYWGRKGNVTCRVSYNINLLPFPFMNFFGVNSIQVKGGARGGIAGWRSVWR
ncbi:MAG: pilus assembly protein [Candidatus Bathyarchaeia archaeon]